MLQFLMFFLNFDGSSVHAAEITDEEALEVALSWGADQQTKVGDYVVLDGSGRIETVEGHVFVDLHSVVR